MKKSALLFGHALDRKPQDSQSQRTGFASQLVNRILGYSQVCFYYGTFNPIHSGHLQNALNAMAQYGYKRIFFIPAKDPPHKRNNPDLLPHEQRVEMARIATQHIPGLHVWSLDGRGKKSTGNAQKASFIEKLIPEGTQIPMISGDDAIQELSAKLRDDYPLKRLLFLQHVRRQGAPLVTEVSINGSPHRINTLPLNGGEADSVGSSEIREKVRKGLPITGMVPPALEAYIREKQLWKQTAALMFGFRTTSQKKANPFIQATA